jgi:hypothetical protein
MILASLLLHFVSESLQQHLELFLAFSLWQETYTLNEKTINSHIMNNAKFMLVEFQISMCPCPFTHLAHKRIRGDFSAADNLSDFTHRLDVSISCKSSIPCLLLTCSLQQEYNCMSTDDNKSTSNRSPCFFVESNE